MSIHIHSRSFPLSDALKAHIKSRIRLALDRYKHRIESINVTLEDVNGPKGGEDMCCKISLKSDHLPAIVIQETAADMYDAINICVHRVKRSASRQLDKFKQHQKGERLRHTDMNSQQTIS